MGSGSVTCAAPLLPGARVLVAGYGLSGKAAAAALRGYGAQVTTVDDQAPDADAKAAAPSDFDLVVASPGWPPHSGLLAAARHAQVPVWSEVELAWQLRVPGRAGHPAPWIAVTGTNGKTTTVQMALEIAKAGGLRAAAVGNVGTPVVEAALDPDLELLIVELSSFQLHYTHSMSALAAAILNIAPDHLDWHGSFDAYKEAKGRIYERVQKAAIYNVADPRTAELVRGADVCPGAHAVGITLAVPGRGELGVVEDLLIDRAFHTEISDPRRHESAAELAGLADLRHLAPGGQLPSHTVANALTAAALTRAAGVPASAVAQGLRNFHAGAHRNHLVAEVAAVRYVNDSKATNAHAAQAALAPLKAQSAVWIAGGLAKGAEFDDLIRAVVGKIRAAVLIGTDAAPLTGALSRHAPEIPVTVIDPGDTGTVMSRAVAAAQQYARAGDTVLLAPACASQDQFDSYAARGAEFEKAVAQLTGPQTD